MQKRLLLPLLFISLLLFNPPLLAQEEKPFRFDWYSFEGSQGFGFKYQVSSYSFLTLNRDHVPVNRLHIQIGTNFYLPYSLFFFSFYGGGGATIDFYKGHGQPYLVTGADAAILFVEALYFFQEEGYKTRKGLRFSF